MLMNGFDYKMKILPYSDIHKTCWIFSQLTLKTAKIRTTHCSLSVLYHLIFKGEIFFSNFQIMANFLNFQIC